MKEMMTSGEIEITHRLVDASNATLLGNIEGFGKVIYKPVAGERPLWDFPDGCLADREVATFKLSDFLGLELVPRTLLREGPFGPGMVQQWIETDPEIDIIAFGQSMDPQLRLLALFDAVINNTDRKFGHLLLDDSGHLFGCDHGVTFHAEEKLRTVIWQFAGEGFTESEVLILHKIMDNADEISSLLSEHLTAREIDALLHRSARLFESKIFPFPSTEWPAVPWPPV